MSRKKNTLEIRVEQRNGKFFIKEKDLRTHESLEYQKLEKSYKNLYFEITELQSHFQLISGKVNFAQSNEEFLTGIGCLKKIQSLFLVQRKNLKVLK